MEMQEISAEKKRDDENEAANELMVEVTTEEEAEPDHYAKLQSPSEDIYTEALFGGAPVRKKAGKETEGNARLYRAGCFFLITICSILLLVIIVLSVKLQTGSTVCSGRGETSTTDKQNPSTCSPEQCQDLFPTIYSKYSGCQHCAKGWLTYGRSCFFLSTFRLTWAESQQNCTSSGGSLAVITSQNVQSFLTRKGKLKYWIGLTQTDATWNWVNNNELQDSYWVGAPQHGDCAYLSSERPSEKNWDRASCEAATYFICQRQF